MVVKKSSANGISWHALQRILKAVVPTVLTITSVIAVGAFTVGSLVAEFRSHHEQQTVKNQEQDEELSSLNVRVDTNSEGIATLKQKNTGG